MTCIEHHLYTCPCSMHFVEGGVVNSITVGMQGGAVTLEDGLVVNYKTQ